MFAGGNRCSVQGKMHASRIRTTPLLTLSQHALRGGVCKGVYMHGRVYIHGESGNWLGGPTQRVVYRGGILFKSGSCTCLVVKLPNRVGLTGWGYLDRGLSGYNLFKTNINVGILNTF